VFSGNYDQAITYYNNALNSNRSNALLKFEFCKLLIQTGKLQEAVESFNKQFPGSKYTPILNVKLAELKSQAFQNKSE
jgi:tetratricopeptide (TPR) repeat protein